MVCGAGGFLGRAIVAALVEAGHQVVAAVRSGSLALPPGLVGHIDCDFQRDLDPSTWSSRVQGFDAVINCVGILRESRSGDFERVHHLAPRALFHACAASGVRRVLQISALGDPRDGAFVASKHALDDDLAELDLEWTVLRPSLVYSAEGSYGGSSLLRALASLPWVLPLPGTGNQPIQPISAEDLGRAVAALLRSTTQRDLLDAVGIERKSLGSFQQAWRGWLRLPPARRVPVPLGLVRPIAALADFATRGPLGLTMLRMLERGNVTTPERAQRFHQACGFLPRTLGERLAAQPSSVQHRWHARIYLLRPLLLAAMAMLWLASGLVGLLLPLEVSATLLAPLGLGDGALRAVVLGASILDLTVGVAVLVPVLSRAALLAMLLMLAGYSLGLGALHPPLWMDPAGGLLKNLVLLPAVLLLLATAERR